MASGRWLARRCMAMRRGPTPVTHEPGTVSGMCFADTSCPWPPAFPPPTPQPRRRRCSPASSVLCRSPTSAARTSSAATSSASPTRTAARHRRRPVDRSPGSRTKSFCACQGLGPRGGDGMLAMAHVAVLPSIRATMSAPRTVCLSRLNLLAYTLPYRRFVVPLAGYQRTARGPLWVATPSTQRTSTSYSLPVSRRTAPTNIFVFYVQ